MHQASTAQHVLTCCYQDVRCVPACLDATRGRLSTRHQHLLTTHEALTSSEHCTCYCDCSTLQERLAIYEKKVMKALTANDLARSKPGTSLNIAAANRFIDAAIPDLSAEQKQQLRNLSQPAVSKAAVSSNRSQKQQKQEQQQQQLQDCHVSSEQLAAEDLNEERTQRAGNGSEYSHPAASGAPVAVSVQQHGTEAGGRIARDKKQGKRKAPSAVDDAGAFLLEVMRNLE